MSHVDTIWLGSRETSSLFHIRLGLSDDASVERVLSDVPFFCVGVMAFAVFTFFLVTRRSSLLATYLYSSTLLAFIAAIFDLSHLLVYGASAGVTREGLSNGLEIAREVGLSLSVGFRLIFLWGLIDAEPPPERPRPDTESLVSFRMGTYSSSWSKLGILGRLIKWLLLLAIISVPVLQLVWRLYWRMHYLGPLYIAESSLEIAVLSIFALKILLNVGLARSVPWRSSLAFYAAPLFALALSLSLAIGNIIFFCFSETTLGRFLQAVSLYALNLWILIIAFRPIKACESPRKERPRSSFQSAPEKGPRPASFLPPLRLPEQNLLTMRRPSVTRLSSFINRVPRPPASPIKESLWNPSQSFHAYVTTEARPSADDDISARSIAMGSYFETVTQLGALRASPEQSGWISSNSAVDAPANTADASKQPETAMRNQSPSLLKHESRDANSFSLSAYYGRADSPLPPPTPVRTNSRANNGSESPIYSLYGILPGNSHRSASSQLGPVSSRISAMIREQREMDKSVSKLLSLRDSLQSPSSGFSLSNFPAPPSGIDSDFPSPTPKRSSRRFQRLSTSLGEQVPTNVGIGSDESVDVLRPQYRMDSQGTQYDVTSFIGAGIRGSGDGVIPRPRRQYLSDIESGDSSSPIEDRQRASRESTMMLNFQSGALLSTYAGGEARMRSPSPQPQLKPLYLGRGTPDTLDSPRVGLPPRPGPPKSRVPTRPVRSTVSPLSFVEGLEPAEVYEKPRPPPLIFRTLNKST